jgi:ABC-type uncharacterized transport system fused permease/ATPase subunit
MTLGEVMQAASAFTIVQGAFNWLVDNYPRLADWTASARRVASFMARSQIDREGVVLPPPLSLPTRIIWDFPTSAWMISPSH